MHHVADHDYLRRRALRLGDRLTARSAELAALTKATSDAEDWIRDALHKARERTMRAITLLDEARAQTLDSLSRVGRKAEAVDLCQSIARRRAAAIVGTIGFDQAPAWAVRGEEAPTCHRTAAATATTPGDAGRLAHPQDSSRYAPSVVTPRPAPSTGSTVDASR